MPFGKAINYSDLGRANPSVDPVVHEVRVHYVGIKGRNVGDLLL